ncbi:putative pyridoxal phosphate-dependent decarboxylase, pyridoxal phosphate-dependent transferase [Helianthus annuus]|nr:putative pyridoxal phosphate-dependent decarboxylase, pyridoxal phosphate-dependent transferase [Helianthus annuus]
MGSPLSEFISSSEPFSYSKEFKPMNPEEFRDKAHKAVDFITDYYKNVETFPVLSQVQPGYLKNLLPEAPPNTPESFDTILRDVQNVIIPGMTHWQSPNFFAYFPATISSAAFVGEMLCTCFNAVGFNWIASPAATELEMVVMDWLATMLHLPKSFMFSGSGGGVLQSTTSESILCTLVAARDRVLNEIGVEHVWKLVVYGSDQTHSTYKKACKLAGIDPRNIRSISTRVEDEFSLSPIALQEVIEADLKDGLVPVYLCVTTGTTSTTAVDPIKELAEVASKYHIWVHVDAAYGGSACICPEYRHFLKGIEKVDSLSLSPHKWLLSYLDCCCLWIKNPKLFVDALSTNPEYLRNKHSESDSVVSYKDWQVGTGRRFKSLRLWFIIRSYGVENLQNHIRADIQMAITFEKLVRSDVKFEIVVPRRFSLVCFRLKQLNGFDSNCTEFLNKMLLERVNSTGQVYLTHTVVGGIYMLRFAVGATLTEERHVISAWELIKEMANTMVKVDS